MLYCPKNLKKYVKNYSEKKGYENNTSKFELYNLKDDEFNLKYVGNIEKNILFGLHISEDYKKHLSIVAVSKNNLKLLLFDNTKSGYNNSFEDSKLEEFNLKEYSDFCCSKCFGKNFKISLFYEYIDKKVLKEEEIELFDYSNSFQWIRISLKCCNCGKKYKNIVDYED